MHETILEVSYSLESAHRLLGYPGKCSRLHGHNYRVVFFLYRDVTVIPEKEPEGVDGMVMDTANVDICLRPIIKELDHRTILADNDPLIAILTAVDKAHVAVIEGRPTAENIAAHIFKRCSFMSHSGRQILQKVRVEENATVAAEYPRR